MKSEIIIGVMLFISVATSLLVAWNSRRVDKKWRVERDYATGGFIASTPYRIGEHTTGFDIPAEVANRIAQLPPVKPTSVLIKSYTKADLMAAYEKGRVAERISLASQVRGLRPIKR